MAELFVQAFGTEPPVRVEDEAGEVVAARGTLRLRRSTGIGGKGAERGTPLGPQREQREAGKGRGKGKGAKGGKGEYKVVTPWDWVDTVNLT